MDKITIPFYVSTNNKHLECLRVYINLFNHFFPNQELNILGYDFPKYEIPPNCNFISMGTQGPVSEWSTDLRNYFLELKDDYFIYGTEDVFFYKKPQIKFINYLSNLIQQDKSIGRINLVDSTEGDNCTLPNSPHYNVSLRKKFTSNECDWGNWELYEQTKGLTPGTKYNPNNYSLNTQHSIWNKNFLLKYLDEGLTPWEFEWLSVKTEDDPQYKVLMVDTNFPIYKKEGYSLGTWTNKKYWLSLLDDKIKQEIFNQ